MTRSVKPVLFVVVLVLLACLQSSAFSIRKNIAKLIGLKTATATPLDNETLIAKGTPFERPKIGDSIIDAIGSFVRIRNCSAFNTLSKYVLLGVIHITFVA